MSAEQRVRIISGPDRGKEGELDGGSMLQRVYRVHLPHEHVPRLFLESQVEFIRDSEAEPEWR